MDLSQQRMKFFIQNMSRIPGLAAAFRQYMMQGSGGELGNLIGSSNAFKSGLQGRINSAGLGLSGLGAIKGAMGDTLLGQSVANWKQNYNMGAFNMANQNVMGAAGQSLTSDDMRNRVIGGLFGTGSDMMSRALFPRTYG
jgi:hypothetical protein